MRILRRSSRLPINGSSALRRRRCRYPPRGARWATRRRRRGGRRFIAGTFRQPALLSQSRGIFTQRRSWALAFGDGVQVVECIALRAAVSTAGYVPLQVLRLDGHRRLVAVQEDAKAARLLDPLNDSACPPVQPRSGEPTKAGILTNARSPCIIFIISVTKA